MRMWMVNTKLMCRKHLLGEHLEIHMFIGSIIQRKRMDGYINNNLLEPEALIKRHEELVLEMKSRGYNHDSELPSFDLSYIVDRTHKIDKNVSFMDLTTRCIHCYQNSLNTA